MGLVAVSVIYCGKLAYPHMFSASESATLRTGSEANGEVSKTNDITEEGMSLKESAIISRVVVEEKKKIIKFCEDLRKKINKTRENAKSQENEEVVVTNLK